MDFASWESTFEGRDSEVNSLAHYGVLGMKWGMRRYQNSDGSLTAAGQKHYNKTGEYGYHYHSHSTKKYQRKAAKAEKKLQAEVHRNVKTSVNGNEATTQVNLTKKMAKLSDKAAKYKNRAKRSAEIDKGEEEYARKISTGKAVAASMLGGGDVMKAYAQNRAITGAKNAKGATVNNMARSWYGGSMGSRGRKAAYIRQDEGKNGLGQKVFRAQQRNDEKAQKTYDRAMNEIRRRRR